MKSVVICGSKRFKIEIRKFAKFLRDSGVTVYEPYLHSGQEEWSKLSDEYKRFVALGLTHDHIYKIKMADIVFIYNQEGYVGNSTTMEIGAAVALNKPIYAFENDDEICRNVLFRSLIKTPRELVDLLQ